MSQYKTSYHIKYTNELDEFLQNEVRVGNIVEAVIPLLSHTNERKNMLLSFDEMRRSLGLPGVYKRAAESIMQKMSFG